MKYSMMSNAVGTVLNSMVKQSIPDKQVRRKIKKEYKEIILRASDIGEKNTLLNSYILAAYFIAMTRNSGMSPEENIKILEGKMRESKLVKALMGNSKGYFSEKKMAFRREWARQTQERKIKNDWVVEVLEKGDDYVFGLDYLECGVCKLCRDENCPELAKYLCSLDYMLVDVIGIGLRRTMTLAEGAPKCDFRFYEK